MERMKVKPTGKVKSEDHRKNVWQGLQNLWEKRILCDAAIVSIDMDNAVSNAHKVVLMSCSKFFYSEFSSNSYGTDKVCLPEASQGDISTILKFIYTGDLYLSQRNLEGVRHLAKLFQINEAEKLCEEFSQSYDVINSEIDHASKNPKSSLETKTKSTFESENVCGTPEVIIEISALESITPVKQTKDQTEHVKLQHESVDSNQKAKTLKKDLSHLIRGKGSVIQSSKDNKQPGIDTLPITKDTTQEVIESVSRITNVPMASQKEQTNGAKKRTRSDNESQTLCDATAAVPRETTELSKTTSKPTCENKQRNIQSVSSSSSTETDPGEKDFNFDKSPPRVKRKCFTPKKLEDFTLLKPKVLSVDVCTKLSPKKGRDRHRKVLSVTEGELDVTPLNITEGVDASKANQVRERSRGRPRKQVDDNGQTTTMKTLDKIFTPGRHCKPMRTKSETENSFRKSMNGLKDGPDIKRKRGRPKGSKNKKDLIVSGIDDSRNINDDTERLNSSDLTEDTNFTGKADPSEVMDSSVKSPQKSKKEKLITKGIKKPKCRRCYEKFETASLLQRHRIVCRKTVPFDMPNKYKRKRCGTCQLDFDDYASFQEHRKIHKMERKKQFGKKPFACDLCDLTFRYENFLACHMFSKHNIPYDDSKFTVLTCQLCDYITVNRWRHKMHMNQHENLRPYICEVCGKGFNVTSSLATHKKSHSEGKHECPDCGKKFSHQHTKVNHVRRVHKKEMPFLCHMCLFKCFGKSELLHHLDKDHNIPLPKGYVRYKCELCDFMTFRKFHFDNHMDVHGGEKQFECKVCHKKYVSKMVLRCHMQFHKEPKHKCTWEGCKYAAVQKNRLEQHIRLLHTHQDEKPFPCHLCTYRAALQGNLNLHLRNVHHLDVRKRKQTSQKGETTGTKAKKKGDKSDFKVYNFPVTNINSSDIVQMAVASCGDISSNSAQIQDQNMETETVVIYTSDCVIPAQLTAAQVNELREQNSTVMAHSLTSMEGIKTLTIVPVHMPEQQTPVTIEHGTVDQPNYQEPQQHLATTNGSETGTQIHFQDNAVISQNESELASALPQNIHTELNVLNNHLHEERMAEAVPGDKTVSEELQTVQVQNVNIQEITTVELASNLGQEMLNTQYTGECFLPDSRNLNLIEQTMETRETFPDQTMESRETFPDQNAYWTNF